MALEKENPLKDLKWFAIVFFAVIFAWFYSGGYERSTTKEGAYLRPPSTVGESADDYGSFRWFPSIFGRVGGPTVSTEGNSSFSNSDGSVSSKSSGTKTVIGSGGTEIKTAPVGKTSETLENITGNLAGSAYKNKVTIENIGSAASSQVQNEYITIKAGENNTNKVRITGWQVKSAVTGGSFTIGSGTRLFYSGQVNNESPIELNPGDTAYIITGRSPVGISFLKNKCSGYLSQFQKFVPTLSSNCPAPINENIPLDPQSFNDKCIDFIQSLSRCRILTGSIPQGITPECSNFVTTKFNYNGCVNDHKNDKDFYSKNWWVYLGRSEKIWKTQREVVELLDDKGLIVDVESY